MYYSEAKLAIDQFQSRHLDKDEKRFPTSATFLGSNAQESKIKFHLIIFPLISTIPALNDDRRQKMKEWERKADMFHKRVLVKIEGTYSRVESAVSHKTVLYENENKRIFENVSG